MRINGAFDASRLSLYHLVRAMRIRVESYSGYTADERPLRFVANGREYEVEEVLDRWYGPDDTWFRVRAQDGFDYVLRHAGGEDAWTIEAFRRER